MIIERREPKCSFSSQNTRCQTAIRKNWPSRSQHARGIEPEMNALQKRVLQFILTCGEQGATDEEIQRALAMNPSTQRPRRVELVDKVLVRAKDERRKTRSGRSAQVWVAV